MNDLQDSIIEPISASADGTRNRHTMFCETTSQAMSYAACLWRQGVLGGINIKTPSDWAPCAAARVADTCPALNMRKEEELAGKAIYFKDRNALRASPRWGESKVPATFAPASSEGSRPAARPAPTKSMLDVIGTGGDLADALTAVAREQKTPATLPPATPTSVPVIPRTAPVYVSAGDESPLAMARRLAAERRANV
jgi:hypothetical protein